MESEKIPLMFRLEEDLAEQVRTIAKIEKRSLNQQIALFLEKQIEVWNSEKTEMMKEDKLREVSK